MMPCPGRMLLTATVLVWNSDTPLLDNSRSENWAASDITYNASAAWLTFTATLSNVSGEFFLFLTDRDGEGWIGDGKSAHVLFDDFELEDLSNPGTNLITDGDFESGDASSWIVEGALRARFASPEDAFSGRCCLHHWAFTSGDVSSGTDLRYRPDPPLLLMTERTYQVACRYRVIHGTRVAACWEQEQLFRQVPCFWRSVSSGEHPVGATVVGDLHRFPR